MNRLGFLVQPAETVSLRRFNIARFATPCVRILLVMSEWVEEHTLL